MSHRGRGALTLLLGLAFVGTWTLLLASHTIDPSRPVVLGYLGGLVLIVKGGVETAFDEPFAVAARERKTLLQWLAFLALVLIAGGIVLATT